MTVYSIHSVLRLLLSVLAILGTFLIFNSSLLIKSAKCTLGPDYVHFFERSDESNSEVDFQDQMRSRPKMPNPYHLDYCRQKNFVRDRSDNFNVKLKLKKFPYSITSNTFALFHERPYKSVDELLFAIRNGKRHWVNASHEKLSPIGKDVEQSYFVPAWYDVPPLMSQEMCDIIGNYSHFITIGDSLSRHLRQGVLMAMKDDLILGGIHKTKKTAGGHHNKNPYYCRCDGQFSEHKWCRENDGLFWDMRLRDMEICSHLPEHRVGARFLGYQLDASKPFPQLPYEEFWCMRPEYKGVFLFLQPGGQRPDLIDIIMKKYFIGVIERPEIQKCLKQNKFHVVFASSGVQSRRLDEKYPWQERNLTRIYNELLETRIRALDISHNVHIPILDWWNLTEDAQTQDGYHYLSDVNLIKAYQVFHLARALKEQGVAKKS